MPDDEFKITLRNDYAFKRVLGCEKNKTALQDFLECVLSIPSGSITGLTLLNKELHKDIASGKTGILDIKVKLKDGTLIDIEIQNVWLPGFTSRILFYWSKIFTQDFTAGDVYPKLPKCVIIVLTGKGFTLSDNIHSAYHIYEDDTNRLMTDVFEIHVLNLERAKALSLCHHASTNEARLIRWLKFIETDSKEERTMLAEKSPVLKILNETIDVMALSPKERALYESRMMLKSDIATGLYESFAQGKAEGAYNKALETAAALKAMGLAKSKIAKATGLSLAEIEKL